jgi:hypothetical protein
MRHRDPPPNAPQDLAPGRPSDPRRSASIATRLRAWWRRPDLDRALASGADPSQDDVLSLRAAQLTEPRTLECLATSIEAATELAAMGGARATELVQLRKRAVLDARPALLGLALRLRDQAIVAPQGAAMASHLVGSSNSPLFANSVNASLWAYARRASAAIDDAREPALR